MRKLIVACVLLLGGVAANALDFAHRPLLAGKASLVAPGFEVTRTLGTAAFAPELRIPVELVYDSSAEISGAFGFGWRSPQLESFVRRDKDGVLWTTPWGEKVRFFPKKGKVPGSAVRIELVEAAKKGRGFLTKDGWNASEQNIRISLIEDDSENLEHSRNWVAD